MGLFNPLLVSAISCYDIAHAYIGLPQNFYHGKPEHVTKKLMWEERGLGGVGLVYCPNPNLALLMFDKLSEDQRQELNIVREENNLFITGQSDWLGRTIAFYQVFFQQGRVALGK